MIIFMLTYTLLVIAVVLTQWGDFWSTNRAIGLPGVYESNPLVRGVGLLPLKLINSVGYSVLLWFAWRNDPVVTIAITVLLVVFYVWVIWNNIRVFERYQR